MAEQHAKPAIVFDHDAQDFVVVYPEGWPQRRPMVQTRDRLRTFVCSICRSEHRVFSSDTGGRENSPTCSGCVGRYGRAIPRRPGATHLDMIKLQRLSAHVNALLWEVVNGRRYRAPR